MDCSLPGSSVHGILQARIVEWVAIPFSRGSSQPRDQCQSLASLALSDGFFTTEPPGKTSKILLHSYIFSFLFWTVCHYVTYLCMYFFLPHHSGNFKRADSRYFVLFTDVSLMPVLHMTHGELSTNSCRREEEKEEGR